jgi:hypothetical protein
MSNDDLAAVSWFAAALAVVVLVIVIWRRGGPHDPDLPR